MSLPLLVLSVCVVLYVIQLAKYVAPRLAPLVAQLVAESLNRQVRIGKVAAFSEPGVAVIQDVEVSNTATFATDRGLPAITIKELQIRYSLPLLLLHPSQAIKAVQAVIVDAPTVYIERFPSGRLNISDLLKPSPKAQSIPFSGSVSVSDGSLIFKDELKASPLHRRKLIFGNLKGGVDFTSSKLVSYMIRGNGPRNVVANISLEGQSARTSSPGGAHDFGIRIDFADAAVDVLAQYFATKRNEKVVFSGGAASGFVVLKQQGGVGAPLRIAGAVAVDGVDARLVGTKMLSAPVTHLRAKTTFTESDAQFVGIGDVAGQRISAQGGVLGFAHPTIYVEADATDIDYGRVSPVVSFLPKLPHGLFLPTPIVAHAWVSGKLNDLAVDATIEAPKLLYQSAVLTTLDADLSYYRRRVVVRSLTASGPFGNGNVSANGSVDLTGTKVHYSFTGSASNINIASLPMAVSSRRALMPLTGSLTMTFSADSTGLTTRFAIGAGDIKGIRFVAAEGAATWANAGPVRLTRFFIRQSGSGIVVASGSIPTDPSSPGLSIQIQAAQLDLSRLTPVFTNLPIGGLLYVNGTVTGTLRSPLAKAHLYGLQPFLGQYGADVLQADVSGNASLLQISRLEIRHFPGRLTAAGTISNFQTGNPEIDIAFSLSESSLSYLVDGSKSSAGYGAPTLPVSGFVDGTGIVSGRLRNIAMESALSLSDGIFDGFQLSDVAAKITLSKDNLLLDSLHAVAANVTASGSGVYSFGKKSVLLNADVRTPDVDEVAHRFAPSLQIFGGIEAAVQVTGALDAPIVSAAVTDDGLAVEGQNLIFDPVKVLYRDRSIDLDGMPLTLHLGSALYSLDTLHLDTARQTVEATADVKDETVSRLLSVVRSSPYLSRTIGGTVNSIVSRMPQFPTGSIDIPTISVTGLSNRPSVSVSANFTAANIAGLRIDRLQTQFVAQQSTVTVHTFHLTGPADAYLDAHGTVDTTGNIDASMEASGIDLALLKPYLANSPAIAGSIEDLTVVATGATRSPDLAASITLDDPQYGNFRIDRIDTGEIEARAGRLTVNDLTFTKEEDLGKGATLDHTVQVSGSLPFAWRSDKAYTPYIAHDEPVDLQAVLPLQSMTFINKLLPTLPVTFSNGTVSGALSVSGTLAEKQVNGDLTIVNASVQPTGFSTGFTNVNVSVALKGQQFTIQKLSAASTFGGTISGSGGGEFAGANVADVTSIVNTALGDVTLALKVDTNNLIVNERKIALFDNAGAAARINGSLEVTGKLLRPTVAGAFTLDKVVGSLPQESNALAVDHGIPAFNPHFDLTVNILPGAVVRTAQLNAQADGSIKLTGSLYHPLLVGNFFVRKGQFFFPTATFRVVPVGTVQLTYRSPEGMEETIDMTATTSISVSQALLARNPAGANSATQYIPTLATPVSNQSAQRYTVTVTIDGRLDTPDELSLQFTSNPPGLTNEQILAALGGSDAIAGLTGGNILGAVQDQVASVFNASVVPKLLQPFENSIGNVFGLEDFSVDYVPDSPVEVTLVKKLSSRLSLQYMQAVNSRSQGAVSSTLEPPEYQIQLGYSFTQRFEATVSTDDQNNTIVALAGVYNF